MSTALVTGAAGALGRAIVRRLTADGHQVAALDRDAGGLGGALDLKVDLRDPAAIEQAFAETTALLGPVGILVNNAAVYPSRPFLEVPLAEERRCTRSTSAPTGWPPSTPRSR
nr:SDR family NAD(P)-dependent oxidoreductase [Nonomuraea sp. SYSU D8015]